MFAELLHIINRSPNNTWNKYLSRFLGDASEQENGWDFKNVVDTAAWTAGTMAISLGIYFLIR